MEDTAIIRGNLKKLSSREVRDHALSESVGGNAGPGCYVVNLGIDEEGRIVYAGNDPNRTNASIRVFTPVFFRGVRNISEMVLDVASGGAREIHRRVAASAWLWNLYREGKEKEILDRFLDGGLEWEGLMELLRSKYPLLGPELEKPPSSPGERGDAGQ